MSKNYFSSSIGQKTVVAVTGLMLIGFIIAHLLGNLQLFLGADVFNNYAKMLQDLGGLLWVARGGLIAAFVLHVVFTIKLAVANREARPQQYKNKQFRAATPASRYMTHLGIILLVFVIVHLLHFTFGVIAAENAGLTDWKDRHDVYSMVILGFQDPRYSVLYIICLIALGAHLSHGIQSVFQTVGFYHEKFTPQIRCFSTAFGWLVALGYISIPLSVLCGLVTL